LWLCLRRAVWAAIGVVLAISWQLFSGMGRGDLIWLTPSSTMMRHPLDVWFFLALVLHQQSGRRAWIVLAGAASALGIWFQTETGIYLLVTFGFYWLLQLGSVFREGRSSGMKAHLFSLGAFYLTAASVLVPLLLYASRGTLFTAAFLPGWLESLIKYGSWGVGALPVAIVPDAPLVLFIGMTAFYMSAISYAVFRSFHGEAGKDDVIVASISAYGLALLLLFVGRSHPFNLCHAAVPFAVVSTMLLFRGCQALGRWLPYSSFAHVLSGGLVLLLLTNTQFLRYPSLLESLFSDAPRAGLSLTSDPVDISGLPLEAEAFVNNFKDTATAIRSVAPDGRDVAILDIDDTLFYYAANVAPWSRYASLFPMILTQQSLEDLQHELVERSPGTVVMRGEHAARPAEFEFAWSPLYQVVKSRYELSQTIGDFEIWRQRIESPAQEPRP